MSEEDFRDSDLMPMKLVDEINSALDYLSNTATEIVRLEKRLKILPISTAAEREEIFIINSSQFLHTEEDLKKGIALLKIHLNSKLEMYKSKFEHALNNYSSDFLDCVCRDAGKPDSLDYEELIIATHRSSVLIDFYGMDSEFAQTIMNDLQRRLSNIDKDSHPVED